jgi:hypothetical protein
MKHLKSTRLWPYPQTRLGWKGLPGINTLPYLESSVIMVAKSFITLAHCVVVSSVMNEKKVLYH